MPVGSTLRVPHESSESELLSQCPTGMGGTMHDGRGLQSRLLCQRPAAAPGMLLVLLLIVVRVSLGQGGAGTQG